MSSSIDWQCSDCGTAIDGPETRRCPSCGGINFFPRADEVPGGERGTVETTVDIERAIERLTEDS